MAFPKMSLMQNLKDLVTKGPQGLVNERMKEHLAAGDELMKLDRSDPEAMQRYLAAQNEGVDKVLKGRFGKNFLSDENRSGVARLQQQAMENQAAMWKMLQEKKPAPEVTPEEPPASRNNPDIDK